MRSSYFWVATHSPLKSEKKSLLLEKNITFAVREVELEGRQQNSSRFKNKKYATSK